VGVNKGTGASVACVAERSREFSMAIPFSLVLGSLRRIDATRVGIVSMLELVAAGIIAYFWLGQHLDAWQLTGCLCVMVGVAILQYERLG